jgi:hypothetical protein
VKNYNVVFSDGIMVVVRASSPFQAIAIAQQHRFESGECTEVLGIEQPNHQTI